MELERQVQIGIVEAALGIVNDPKESKAVRRKHRLVYQQSQRRLQELEARLNFLRQSRNKTHHSTQFQHSIICNAQSHLHANVKHRTKKPRPPLDGTGIIIFYSRLNIISVLFQKNHICLILLEIYFFHSQ